MNKQTICVQGEGYLLYIDLHVTTTVGSLVHLIAPMIATNASDIDIYASGQKRLFPHETLLDTSTPFYSIPTFYFKIEPHLTAPILTPFSDESEALYEN